MDPGPAVASPNLFLTFIFILGALVLVCCNAFFVAAEFAIVKVRRTRLEELSGQGVKSAKAALILVDQLDDYLSATQLGITLVSLALGWIGEESFYNLFLILWPDPTIISLKAYHFIAAAFSFFVITMLHVVLGELVPEKHGHPALGKNNSGYCFSSADFLPLFEAFNSDLFFSREQRLESHRLSRKRRGRADRRRIEDGHA